MGHLKLLLAVLAIGVALVEGQFQVGVGRADVTGPSAEVHFVSLLTCFLLTVCSSKLQILQMGYAQTSQRGAGIHTRQFSRVFIVQDAQARRIVYASVDVQAISDSMRRDVKCNH